MKNTFALSAMVILAALTSSCAQQIVRVDFKYSSLSHMSFRESMTTLNSQPSDLVYKLSDAFRRQGATVIERKKLDYYLAVTDDADACWAASNEIYQQEIASYRNNKYSEYQRIDRKKPFKKRSIRTDCTIFTNSSAPLLDSWLLVVEFPARSASTTVYTPNLDSFFVFGQSGSIQGLSETRTPQQVGMQITTRLYIWAWRTSDDKKTNVYLEGRPVSGQLEAAPGNSIGWQWWQISDGYQEQKVVRAYVLLLEDYDRGMAAPAASRPNE